MLDYCLPSLGTTLGWPRSMNLVSLSVCDMTKYKNMHTSSVIMTTVNKKNASREIRISCIGKKLHVLTF